MYERRLSGFSFSKIRILLAVFGAQLADVHHVGSSRSIGVLSISHKIRPTKSI